MYTSIRDSESRRLAARIEREDPRCRVTELWHYGQVEWDEYSMAVVDMRTGYQFILHSPAEWDERVKAAEWPPLEE